MLNVYFNPYPGMSTDYESGKNSLLSTANTYWELFKDKEVAGNNPEGDDSIKFFSLAEDKEGARYTPSSFLREYSGRERELIKRFLLMFDKGAQVKIDDIFLCEDWELSGFNFAAPILEYALRQDGMAITISDDADWKTDFFSFIEQPLELPNIHGQENCQPLQEWIQGWSQRNLSFKSLLEETFNILFCGGATNTCFPSRHEEEGVIGAFGRAQDCGYEVDDDLIRIFKTKHGNILELRSYGDGVRTFLTMDDGRPIIGGFYRKSMAVSQNKAGEYAAKRLKEQKYL